MMNAGRYRRPIDDTLTSNDVIGQSVTPRVRGVWGVLFHVFVVNCASDRPIANVYYSVVIQMNCYGCPCPRERNLYLQSVPTRSL